jgi:hypothetical protein
MEDQVIISVEHINEIFDKNQKISMKKDKNDDGKLVGWLRKNDILYMIKMSGSGLINFLSDFDQHTFRLALAKKTGSTRTGETLQLAEILCDDEMSEEEIYRSGRMTQNDVSRAYDEIAKDCYRYRTDDEGFGGLTGEEADIAKWNCD